MDMFVFTGLILSEDEGYSALCPELDVASQGESPQEAKEMLLDAASLHLEGAIEDGLPYLRPVSPVDDPRYMASERIVDLFRLKVEVNIHAYA